MKRILRNWVFLRNISLSVHFTTLLIALCVASVISLASGVYPVYAVQVFEKQLYEILITPDHHPIIWRNGTSDGIADFVDLGDPVVMQSLEICNSVNNCLQEAVDAGGYYFLLTTNTSGDAVTAYYDENGDIVGVSTEQSEPPPETMDDSPAIASTVAIGTLQGEFTVTPSGAASYVIPIEIPPGTNGVQPELSLVYDSQAGNGVLGFGWSIGGISQITRCPKNRAIDDVTGAITYTSSDRFCLDGQRLILVSGIYGANNSQYRTEIDSQQIITARGTAGSGPAYFEVVTPGDSKLTYGYYEEAADGTVLYDSRLEANQSIIPTLTVDKWALGKVEDINGNYYKLAYQQDVELALPYIPFYFRFEQGNSITHIDYTGNYIQSTPTYARVKFNYEDRVGVDVYAYRGGSGEVIIDRLKSIETYVDGALVKQYKLTYSVENTTKHERITSIQECGVAQCKPPTNFSWTNGTMSLTEANWNGPQGWGSAEYTRTGDFNGDGLTDIFSASGYGAYMKISTGSGFTNTYWGQPYPWGSAAFTWTGDFDGNGLTDVATAYADKVYVHKSTGSGFTSSTWITGENYGDPSNNYTGDFDGDGRTDLAIYKGNNQMKMYLSNNGSSFKSPVYWYDQGLQWGGGDYRWTGDYNGDGLTDIASANGNNLHVLYSTGTGFTKSTTTYDQGWGGSAYVTSGDFNGDGLTDIASLNNGAWHVWRSNGKSFGVGAWTGSACGSCTIPWTGDFNGDGKTDIAARNGNILHLHLSTGYSFNVTSLALSSGWGNQNITGSGDFNGDGLADMWSANGYNAYMKLSTGSVPNLMTSATNGLGNTSSVYYTPLTNNTYYTKGTSAYPTLSVQSAMQVVRQKRTPDGLGGNTITNYSYEKYRVDLGGRGPLGFKRTTSDNLKTGLKTIVDYNHTFPYIGMVQREDQLLNGYLISRNDKTPASWPTNRAGGVTHIPYIANGIVKSYDPFDSTNTVIKTVATATSLYNDSTGNIQNTTVKTTEPGNTDEYITTTSYLYESPGSAHCDNYLPTTISTYKTGPQGTSPIAVQQQGYDNCRLKTETGSVNGKTGLTKVHSYDDFGHVDQTTISGADIATRSVSTVYDTRGRFPFRTTNEHGHVVETQSDSRFGGITRSIDANGLETTWVYDEFGRQTEQNNPDGSRTLTSREWCTTNCLVGALSAGLATQSADFFVRNEYFGGTGSVEQMAPDVITYFDTLGREIRTETSDASGRIIYQDTNYDNLGRVRATSQPYFSNAPADKNPSLTDYDALSRPKKQTSPDGGVVDIIYDGFNVTYNTTVIDPVAGTTDVQTRQEINNFIGQNLQSIDNDGNSVYREFDANGNNHRILTPSLNPDGSVLDPKGTVTTFLYDDFGRKTAMLDPDMGLWGYSYNVLSELVSQTNARGQTTSMRYDLMGRIVTRTDDNSTVTTWHYNDNLNAGDTPSTMGIGKLDSVVMVNSGGYEQYLKTIEYEPVVGLPFRTTETHVRTQTFVTKTSYDRFWRPEILSYPEMLPGTGIEVKNVYDAAGLLAAVVSTDGTITFWKADMRDGVGRILRSRQAITASDNGIDTWHLYDEVGRTTLVSTARSDATLVYEGIYQYDILGNLRQRDEQRAGVAPVMQQYEYDGLNRLIRVTTEGAEILTNRYDALGNIRNKSDVGDYSYNSTRPHAVTNVAGISFSYNANGSLASTASGDKIVWTPFNKPKEIRKTQPVFGTYLYTTRFDYGPDRSRFKRIDTDWVNSKQITTHYVGGSYEKVVEGSTTVHKHYIRGGEGVTAVITVADNGTSQETALLYLHRDYQGSVVAVTNAGDMANIQLGFDSHGQRKQVVPGADISTVIGIINRGYTGHEHLDAVGMIHMNGRVYSPIVGRFLSADPIVQAPNNLQSYNRYSYVFNNPISYTDPSGYRSLRDQIRRVGNLHNKAVGAGAGLALSASRLTIQGAIYYSKPAKRFMLKHAGARLIGQVGAGIADAFGCLGACSATYSAYIADISGGSYADIGRAVNMSIAATAALAQVHDWNYVPKILAHGAIGGTMAHVSGGRFADGFWGAAISAAAAPLYGKAGAGGFRDHIVYNSIVASLVGGVASQATGGSFSRGARAALYGMVFNHLLKEFTSTTPATCEVASDCVRKKVVSVGPEARYEKLQLVSWPPVPKTPLPVDALLGGIDVIAENYRIEIIDIVEYSYNEIKYIQQLSWQYGASTIGPTRPAEIWLPDPNGLSNYTRTVLGSSYNGIIDLDNVPYDAR